MCFLYRNYRAHTYAKEGKAIATAVRHLRTAGHRISIDGDC